jgi:alpha-N-arabinofuranosidase
VNVLQAMIETDGPKMALTPTYYAFLMYRPFQGATALPVNVTTPDYAVGADKVPAIDVTAARGTDGAIYVGLINSDPDQNADVALALDGAKAGAVSGQLLTGANMDSRNDFGKPEGVHPVPFTGGRWSGGKLQVHMPSKSVVVLKLQ